MKNVVIYTGAGLGFESGIPTYKVGMGKEQFDMQNIATQEQWDADPEKVLAHFNELRVLMRKAKPGNAHKTIAALEADYRVAIVTTNIDDLHERAGSSIVVHLHGDINKVRSTADDELVYQLDNDDLLIGDECELGSQLRPHVVFKDEEVPNLEAASRIFGTADILIVVRAETFEEPGKTLIELTPEDCEIFVVAPKEPIWISDKPYTFMEGKAIDGVPAVVSKLLDDVFDEFEGEENEDDIFGEASDWDDGYGDGSDDPW